MKMPEVIDTQLFSPCGMDCMVCYVYLKKDKPCHGCMADNANKPERCKSCAIVLCTKGKSIRYCIDCLEFPCKKIRALEASYQKRYCVSLIENSTYFKAHGPALFFARERARWTCPHCTGVISLHDGACTECGHRVTAPV